MSRVVTVAVIVALHVGGAVSSVAQETRPGGGGMMGPGGMMGHGGQGGQGGMMGPGGMMGSGGMMGMRGGMMGGMAHLEHMMVHNPKAAARLMRFRADMLRAMSEVLQRHAAELDKAQ